MAACLAIGIALWYMFRRSILGRWRDIIRLCLACCLSYPLHAQTLPGNTGAPMLIVTGANYYDPGQFTILFPGNGLGNDNPATPLNENGFNPNIEQQLVYDGTQWVAEGWLAIHPTMDTVQRYRFTLQPANGELYITITVGGESSTIYLPHNVGGFHSLQGGYLDPGTFTQRLVNLPNGGRDSLTHGFLTGSTIQGNLNPTGGTGSGSSDPGAGFVDDADPERLRENDFDLDEGIDQGNDGDFTNDLTAVFENSTIESAANSNELPFSIPTLNHDDDLASSVDFVMTSFLGSAWSSPAADSTHEKFLELFGVSSWLQLIGEIEASCELARDTYFAQLRTIVRTVTTVVLSWFAFSFVLTCYNSAMNLGFFNLMAETTKDAVK